MNLKYKLLTISMLFANIIFAQSQEITQTTNKEQSKTESSATLVENQEQDTTAMQYENAKKQGFFKGFINYFKQANVDKTYKKGIDFSFIGGPHYANATGVSLGVLAAGIYRTDVTDQFLQPSTVSIFGDISTTGFYLLGVRGNHHFPGRKHRVDYTAYFYSFPSGFWGFGYDSGKNAIPGSYKRSNYFVKADYVYSISKGLKVGGNASVSYIKGSNWDENAKKFMSQIPNAQQEYLTIGVGAFVMYDTRDFIPNASRGIYAKVDQRFYPKFLGNRADASYSSTEIFFNAYHKLWKGAILAYDLQALFTYGNTPWTGYATTGGSYRMRGYYEGRFRDRNAITTQAELRQNVWRRIGVTAWGGFGNVFSSFQAFSWNEMLPNYGVGLRWEFKNKMNVRLDYGWGLMDGFGKRQQGFIFNMSEAF